MQALQMHINKAETATNEIHYQMISNFSEILLFDENWDANFSLFHFTLDTITYS